MSEPPSAARFPTTCWGRILEAGNPAVPDLCVVPQALCRPPPPRHIFPRTLPWRHDPETAQDLVQGLFASLLERNDLRELETKRGRFRSFLMACWHALPGPASRSPAGRQFRRRADRDSDRRPDGGIAVRRRAEPRPHRRTAVRGPWALMLLDHVLPASMGRWRRSDKRRLYERLRPALLGHEEARPTRDRRRAGPDPGGREDGRPSAADTIPRTTPRGDRSHRCRTVRYRRRDPRPPCYAGRLNRRAREFSSDHAREICLLKGRGPNAAFPGVPTMVHDRRCPRCGQPLPPDARRHLPRLPAPCRARAGLRAAPLDTTDGDEVTIGFESANPGRVLEALAPRSARSLASCSPTHATMTAMSP